MTQFFLEAFERILETPEWQNESRAGFYETCRIAEQVRVKQDLDRSELQLVPASNYIAAVNVALEARAAAEAAKGYGRYRWLWYLRRIPAWAFGGALSTTGPYDSALAEVLATRGAGITRAVGRPTHDGEFPLDGSTIKRIAWLAGFTQGVSQFHVNQRVAGKNGVVSFDFRLPGLPFPACQVRRSATLEYEIAEYDRRVARQKVFGRAGIPIDRYDPERHKDKQTLFVVARTPGPAVIVMPPQGGVTRPVAMRYLPTGQLIEDLHAHLSQPEFLGRLDWSPELRLVIELLCVGSIAFARSPVYRENLLSTGYIVLSRQELEACYEEVRDELRESFPLLQLFPADTSGLSFSDRLLAVEGEPFPLRAGPIAFIAGDGRIGIDLCNASGRLTSLLTFPRVVGDAARIHGKPFEAIVQAEIDRSIWAPQGKLRSLIGHEFRQNGQPITDLDALAAKDRTLLLVSCKNIIYRPEHDQGLHSALASAEGTITKSVKKYAELEALLREQRVRPGEYNLSAYDQFLTIVVTPQAFFVHEPLLSQTAIPGLRTYTTFEELREWLAQ